MNFDFSIAGVATITAICYFVALGVKNTSLDNKWIPLICGTLGGILGVVGMYTVPAFPTTDILSSIALGIESGLAATGINQLYKQLVSNKKEE